jgi:fructose-specific phosphotransferase system IIA component
VNSITDIVTPERIMLDVEGKKKKAVIRELAELFEPDITGDPSQLVKLLLKREKMASTGIGHGVAIPHVMTEMVDETLMAIGRSSSGVPFDSIDNRPVRLFFFLIGPPASTAAHLKLLSKLSRIITDETMRRRLLEAQDAEEVIRILREGEEA